MCGDNFGEILLFDKLTSALGVKEFKATGADLLITARPYCKDNFQKVMTGKDKERIKDLTELVDERI